MAEIVNLRQFRKAKDRQAKRAEGDANAAKFGRSRAERDLAEARAEKARSFVEGHRRAAALPAGAALARAVPADAPALAALLGPDFEPAAVAAQLATRFTLCLTLDGALVGTAALGPAEAGAAEIRNLRVAPAQQRRGLGRALVLALIEEARGLGLVRVTLQCSPALEGFYAGLGFRSLGTTRLGDAPLREMAFTL